MYLCLDVGNSQMHGGFYYKNKLLNDFRLNTRQNWSSDQLGIFFTSFCHENAIDYKKLKAIGISSVVPSIDHHLQNASIKYFKKKPFFIKLDIKSELIVDRYKNPQEIGADLICGAISGIKMFPKQNLLVVDMGTATTITAISANKEFLGGIIIPGIAIQANSLSSSAEQLFTVEIKKPNTYIGKVTSDCIQSGIYYGHLGTLQYLISNAKTEVFNNKSCIILATGGFARLYQNENVFDKIIPDLVLKGIIYFLEMNSYSVKTV